MTVKTFRGLLADGGQDKIRLAGGKLEHGYRIVNLEIIGNKPGVSNPVESLVALWKVEQSSVGTTIDFTDSDLLGVALWTMGETTYTHDLVIIFDNEIFNQDIFITHSDIAASEACNYMLKLEQVKMSGPEAAAVNFRAGLTHGGA
tara:strand:- start:97 stop:534 length:438 start_codon:yes stop_codon:yes gene_type:complete